jgi:uncharacterized protein involved in type VI secretion and phage assembly
MRQFWGKYRGSVIDNADPLMLGRVQVSVPAVLGEVLTAWAMPCVPYAGLEVGFCMTPAVGAAVWVEFEGGDPDYPIWTGCYWREGERPPDAATAEMRMIQTQSAQLRLDDTPGEGGFTLRVNDPAVATPILLTASSDGFSITIGETILRLDEAGAVIAQGSARIRLEDPLVTIDSA